MSFFIDNLPANAYIPTDDIHASSSYSYPSTPSSDNASLPSHPVPPFEDYPSHILWAPRLGTIELPDEEDFVAITSPEASYYEEPYDDELEEELEEDLQQQMDEIIDWFPPAFVHHFGQDRGHERSRRHARPTASSPYLTPPEKHCGIPSHRLTEESCILSPHSTLTSMVKRSGDDVPLANGDGYGISSRLSPLPHVMVCAPITLYKLLPRWA